MKNVRFLTITLLAALAFAGTGSLLSRHGHRGRSYWGGRGYWGGYGWGAPYWGGYYGPRFGVNLTWPAYYPETPFAKDNAGQTYWRIYNDSPRAVYAKTDRDEATIPPFTDRRLYRKNSFNIRINYQGKESSVNTRQHDLKIFIDETGKPHVKV
jgi:hypothetical protein